MAIIDVVRWDAPDSVYAYKYPSNELSTWTQLIVAESQEAVLLKEGQMIGPFTAGRYTLDTDNVPLLTSLFKLPLGGKSPFTASVWFVNRTQPLDVRWGTADPVQVQDPRYAIMLPVRAYGQYGVQVDDTRKFLTKLVGTMGSFDRDQLVSYFRGIILTLAKDAIANYIVRRKISVLEISANLKELSGELQAAIEPEMAEFGLKLIRFTVNSISVPEDDPAVARLKEALAQKASYDILGTNIQQQRSFDVMQDAASNQGAAVAAPMGAGMGLGMGVAIGQGMGQAMGGVAQTVQPAGLVCPGCHAANPPGTSFCAACGTRLAPAPVAAGGPCRQCGKALPAGAKFCPDCGTKTVAFCSKCGTELAPGAKFCPNCGTPAA